jgi:hypothetical protein
MTPLSRGRSTVLPEGLSAGWPICLGYLPIGTAFGVLAQKAGLTPLQIGLMSIMVFAGSAQFIAVSMLAVGASAPAIIATTFVVNLRHVLMSSALAIPTGMVYPVAGIDTGRHSQRAFAACPGPGRGAQGYRFSAARVLGGPADLCICLVDAIIGGNGDRGDVAVLVGRRGGSHVVHLGG